MLFRSRIRGSGQLTWSLELSPDTPRPFTESIFVRPELTCCHTKLTLNPPNVNLVTHPICALSPPCLIPLLVPSLLSQCSLQGYHLGHHCVALTQAGPGPRVPNL